MSVSLGVLQLHWKEGGGEENKISFFQPVLYGCLSCFGGGGKWNWWCIYLNSVEGDALSKVSS